MGKFAAPAFYSKTVNRFTLRADPSAAPHADSALGWGCVGEGGEEIHNEGDEKYSIEEFETNFPAGEFNAPAIHAKKE